MSYTPDQRGMPCKLGMHDWEFKHGSEDKYYECKQCHKRKVVPANDGYYRAVDFKWLTNQS